VRDPLCTAIEDSQPYRPRRIGRLLFKGLLLAGALLGLLVLLGAGRANGKEAA
jgi:hypothetical protein